MLSLVDDRRDGNKRLESIGRSLQMHEEASACRAKAGSKQRGQEERTKMGTRDRTTGLADEVRKDMLRIRLYAA